MEINPRLRDTMLIPLGFLVILLIFKFTGVISTYSMALGIAATLALLISIKILPSRTMRVIAGIIVAATLLSIIIPWFLASYFPYTQEGLKERRELTDLWLGEQTGGEVTSLAVLRKNCRDIEDAILTNNLRLLAQNLERVRKNQPFDPEKFQGDIDKFNSIQEVRRICSDYLTKQAKLQVGVGQDGQNVSFLPQIGIVGWIAILVFVYLGGATIAYKKQNVSINNLSFTIVMTLGTYLIGDWIISTGFSLKKSINTLTAFFGPNIHNLSNDIVIALVIGGIVGLLACAASAVSSIKKTYFPAWSIAGFSLAAFILYQLVFIQ